MGGTNDKGGRRMSERAEDEADEAYLLKRERGEPAEHADPARAAAYERLKAGLGKLPHPPSPAGWRDEVMATIERQALRRRIALSLALVALALAVAALVWRWAQSRPGAPAPAAPSGRCVLVPLGQPSPWPGSPPCAIVSNGCLCCERTPPGARP